MTSRILVPVDGSDPARAAVSYACEQFPEASLTLLYVMDPMVDYSRRRAHPGYAIDDGFKNEREKGESVLEACSEVVPEAVTAETELIAGSPGRAIVKYADEHDVDGIVMGSHGREGVARYLLGSVAEHVLRRSAVPVTIVRD